MDVEIVKSIDSSLVGGTFPNCYTFNADGTWDHPLYPRLGPFVPGVWVQHTEGAKIKYTAYADAMDGTKLVQQGVVTPALKKELEAYSTVFIDGVGFFAELISVGREVDGCPTP